MVCGSVQAAGGARAAGALRKLSMGPSVRARANITCAASSSSSRERVMAMAAKPVTTSEQTSMQGPTVEQQRAAAREMVAYFKDKKMEA